jgi:hypothetical protein
MRFSSEVATGSRERTRVKAKIYAAEISEAIGTSNA